MATTVDPVDEERSRSRGGFVGVARERHGHNGNGVAREQLRDLDGIEPSAAIRDGAPDDLTGSAGIRRKILRQARRRRHQHVDRLPIAHEMHEAAHRICFGRILGNACPLEGIALRPGPAEPNRQDGFRLESAGAMRLHRRDNGLCRLGGRGERGRDVHRQDGVAAGIAEQGIACSGIARAICIAGNIDRISSRPDRRQSRIEPRHRVG